MRLEQLFEVGQLPSIHLIAAQLVGVSPHDQLTMPLMTAQIKKTAKTNPMMFDAEL